MLIGYARVSTQDQNLDLQREALTKAGCEKIMEDQISGARAERPGLTQALGDLRAGDTLVVWKLDRLGRSVRNLIDLVSSLQARDVQFKSFLADATLLSVITRFLPGIRPNLRAASNPARVRSMVRSRSISARLAMT